MENKITEKELQTIKNHRSKINELMQQIGVLEANKHAGLHEVAEINKEINDFKEELEAKYGSINIDIENGGTYVAIDSDDVKTLESV